MNRKWEIEDATRKPYAVRAILFRVHYTAVCFYTIIIVVAVVISERAPMFLVEGGGAQGQEINPIQDYDNENIAARRMSPNTLRAHDIRQW